MTTDLIAASAPDAGSVGWAAGLASLTLVALAVALSLWFRFGLERQLLVAAARAAGQLFSVGVFFTTIFRSDAAIWWAWGWTGVMVAVATTVVRRRAEHPIERLAPAAGLAIALAAALSLGIVFGFGVIDYEPVSIVVVAGITIGNAVPAAALGANQSVAHYRDGLGELEALISLGFSRRQMTRILAPPAARTSLLPQIERTKVVGLIALPGAMTGLLLAGVDPTDAVLVQLLVMYLILGTVTVCVTVTVATIARAALTDELLVADWVKPGIEPGAGPAVTPHH